MRITGGRWRGRRLQVPATGLRPSTDMLRQALFNLLGSMSDCTFLDLYAGSGAVGLEAASRAARVVWLVECGRRACQAIQKNVTLLQADCVITRRRVVSFIDHFQADPFDFIFLDPPYNSEQEKAALEKRNLAGLLLPGGRLVMELSRKEREPDFQDLVRTDRRHYGDSCLLLYQRPGQIE